MIIKTGEVRRFLATPREDIAAVLLYGPNLGLVRERAEQLGQAVAGALDDPFRVADLAPKAIAGDTARLVDEAAALSMTGGRRLVRVRGAGNEVAGACEALMERPPGPSLVVVEAGELNRRAPLRVIFEKAANGAAVACYDDDEAALRGVIRERLAAHGMNAAPAAVEALLARLGSDRKVAVGELDKLTLYAHGSAVIDEEDVLAAVGDAAEATLDDLADAVGLGNHARAGKALDKLAADGVPPVRVIGALQRHFQRLHWARARMSDGAGPAAALGALRPPVFFKRRAAMTTQLGRWSAEDLARAMGILLEAEIGCKTTGRPAALVCAHAVLRVTHAGRPARP